MSWPAQAVETRSLFKTTILLPRKVRSIALGELSLKANESVVEDEIQKKMDPNDPVFREWEEEWQARSEASYKFGFEDGKKIGIEEGKESVLPVIASLKEAANTLIEQRQHLSADLDHVIVELSLSIAERIIRKEVSLDKSIIRETIRDSLKYIDDHERIVIRVNPEDWQNVKAYEDEIRSFTNELKILQIQEDDHVESGGCVIESNTGMMDAQIKTQLEEIARNLSDAHVVS